MKKNTDLIERSFMQIILERMKGQGMNFSEFAVRVWPDLPKKTAITKLRDLREPNPTTGKYQHLSLASAFRMAGALGEEGSYLVALARGQWEREEKERGEPAE
jgi:hypothetical protein